jgi:hypothetical protein
MSNHLILALKPLPALAPLAPLDRTIMRTVLRMHIRVRVEQVLRLERLRRAARVGALEAPDEGVRDAVDAHAVDTGWDPVRRRSRLICGWCVGHVTCEVRSACIGQPI